MTKKVDLEDTTFIILIRIDSIERLENIISVTSCLCKYFNTNIFVLEADRWNNGILKSLLNKKIFYQFVEDKDNVLYKTKYYNQMVLSVETPFISIWDADIVIDRNNIEKAITLMRNNTDAVYPYNGICLDVPEVIKLIYLKNKDIRFLKKHTNKMMKLHERPLVGGAVFLNREKFIKIGLDNEIHYGWGNEDFDRYYRMLSQNYVITKLSGVLFHLTHPREINSKYRSAFQKEISLNELNKYRAYWDHFDFQT